MVTGELSGVDQLINVWEHGASNVRLSSRKVEAHGLLDSPTLDST